ncbi:NADH:flavin oxidoreductase/NADH oxidase [Actinomadura rugatobispora]|uniref:NADH:flavin oxidoreductase/NADH oxidase n=1 Tax=Actinomadura rugatobispora TaxID=1994 RepID=A0ABW1A926_9ACTN|nr:NADH:flavin oxidoreductase/NADH oxidase [Actinomadura rugatobispora]
MTRLFTPITLRALTIKNRAWLSPMCQYSVETGDGVPADWHLVHLGARAAGGFGLILTESTAVSPDARISPQDTGLWNEDQVAGWARIVDFVHAHGAAVGVQLGHAGRKGSAFAPWHGRGPLPVDQGGWSVLGPSPLAYPGLAEPREATAEELAGVVRSFRDAARRAGAAGFDLIEIHAGHGYLLHQFLSPLSNRRTDRYGGSFENRTRLLREVVDAVRGVWPDGMPLLVRLSASDWIEGGWTPEETADLAGTLRERGVDLMDVSSGGLDAAQRITVGPGYQVPFARRVRAEAGVPVGAVGLITRPEQAEAVLAEGSADAVLLAREALRDPSWPLRAARELGAGPVESLYPRQYLRAATGTPA